MLPENSGQSGYFPFCSGTHTDISRFHQYSGIENNCQREELLHRCCILALLPIDCQNSLILFSLRCCQTPDIVFLRILPENLAAPSLHNAPHNPLWMPRETYSLPRPLSVL